MIIKYFFLNRETKYFFSALKNNFKYAFVVVFYENNFIAIEYTLKLGVTDPSYLRQLSEW